MIGKRGDAFTCQPRRQRVHLAPRGAVDDAALLPVPRQNIEELAFQSPPRQHAVQQVRTIEGSDDLDRIAQAQLRGDVAADPGRRGGRVRVHTRSGQQFPQPRELPVFRPEVVAPLADAVRLVHGNEAHAAPGDEREEAVAAFPDQPLGRDIEETVSSFAQPLYHRAFFRRRQRAVEESGGHPVAHERIDLILHQRDERRHHQGEAGTHEGWRLEAERLTASRGQHHQRVAAGEHSLHRFALKRPEGRVAPIAAERVVE